MSVASSLEAGLRVPGNYDEFPFPLQMVSTELFSTVVSYVLRKGLVSAKNLTSHSILFLL